MIQRIQSIYLLLAGLFPAITFFVPLLHFSGKEQELILYGLGYDATLCQEMIGLRPWGLLIITVLNILIPIITIFGFKNRKSQIKRINLSILLLVGWYLTLAAYTFSIANNTELTPSFEVFLFCPLVSMFFLYLSSKAIKKDEALIRAADRIR